MRRLELQLTILVAAVFVLGMCSAIRGREIFPFASWFLFSRIPQEVSTYELWLVETDGAKVEPPQSLTTIPYFLRSPQSSTVRDLIQRLGRGASAGNREEMRLTMDLLRSQFHKQGGSATLVLMKLKYDPLVRLAHRPDGGPRTAAHSLAAACHMSLPWQRDLESCALPQAQMLVRAFYALLAFMVAQALPDFVGLTRERELLELWPVAWLEWLPPGRGATIVFLTFIGAVLVGAVAPGPRWVRVLVFVALLQYVALRNSEGRVSHSLHLPLLVSLVFVFLPPRWHRAGPEESDLARQTALVLRGAQLVILLTYTMSGLGKLGASLFELASGQISSFHPTGFQRLIAARLLETASSSPLAHWIIDQPAWVTWPLLPATIYFQVCACCVAFRPVLHRPWGVLLILFHLGNAFILTIHFPYSVFMLALFLLASPFAPPRFDVRRVMTDLPLLSAFWRVASRRMSPPTVTASSAGPESAHR